MKNLNEVLAEIRKIGLNNDANSIVKIIKGNQCFAESNLNKIQDLVIHRGGISNVVYRAEEVDQEDYDGTKKNVERTKKSVDKMKKEIKTMYVGKEMADTKKSINAGERFIKDWEEKIEPWMLSILESKKVISAFHVKEPCPCGNNKDEEFAYYDGSLGYEAYICKKCGRYFDHEGMHEAEEFTKPYVNKNKKENKHITFIEKKHFIKPENSKYTSYIADFYTYSKKPRSFYLEKEDWDDFANYMSENHANILVTLVSETKAEISNVISSFKIGKYLVVNYSGKKPTDYNFINDKKSIESVIKDKYTVSQVFAVIDSESSFKNFLDSSDISWNNVFMLTTISNGVLTSVSAYDDFDELKETVKQTYTSSQIKIVSGFIGSDDKNLVKSSFKDPTKEEMVKFLHDKYKGHLDYTDEELEFPIEAAIYWYAYDYHSGQNSNLYSALSTSEYKPGRLHKSIDDTNDDVAQEMYSNLQTKYGE